MYFTLKFIRNAYYNVFKIHNLVILNVIVIKNLSYMHKK